jgi:transcription antitermination factor NusG
MINQSSWLLLYTRSGKEMFAAENLANQNIEYYLPMESVWVKKVRTAKPVEKPLFPRYLFARPNEGMLRSISGTRGVSGIVRFGDEPYAVDDSIIIGIQTEILLANEQRQAKGVLPKYGFAVNEMVRIIDEFSTWRDRLGRFKGPGKKQNEILIEFDLPNFGKTVIVPISSGSVMVA